MHATFKSHSHLKPLQTEFPVFWKFLGILRNSQKFLIMQMTLAN